MTVRCSCCPARDCRKTHRSSPPALAPPIVRRLRTGWAGGAYPFGSLFAADASADGVNWADACAPAVAVALLAADHPLA